mgnify:CR=1 FL=1
MFAWVKNYRKIIPFIHFFATFVWERYIFFFTGNWDFMLSVARNNIVSDKEAVDKTAKCNICKCSR